MMTMDVYDLWFKKLRDETKAMLISVDYDGEMFDVYVHTSYRHVDVFSGRGSTLARALEAVMKEVHAGIRGDDG